MVILLSYAVRCALCSASKALLPLKFQKLEAILGSFRKFLMAPGLNQEEEERALCAPYHSYYRW